MKGTVSLRIACTCSLLLLIAGARAEVYEIDPAQSVARILVYSAGPLAKLGHNHVVSASQMSGEIDYRPDAPDESKFVLRLPVTGLIVDDPSQRAAAGRDFSAMPDEDAIQGTRDNMLSPKVLDATRFPEIELRSVGVEGALPELRTQVSIEIHGVRRQMLLPVQVQLTQAQLLITGSFEFKQSTFGIRPLKILLGAIAVQDELSVQYHLVAVRKATDRAPGRVSSSRRNVQ